MSDAATLMDRVYRRQRHVYDASRKFYLLGRDALIAELNPPQNGSVLEIGCGTGRNLIKIAETYPSAQCYGLDVSGEMLATARKGVSRAGLTSRIRLVQADATSFDPQDLFGRPAFDRIVISYALSMIPPWEKVLLRSLQTLAPGGSLHIVDFGDQAGLPAPFRAALNRWLAWFDVTPRVNLQAELAVLTATRPVRVRSESWYRGYAVHALVQRVA